MIRIVLFLLALPLLIPPTALADGCFVWKNRQVDILEPEQKAVIVFDKGWEDLILEVKYEGPPGEFGWIVPVPSRPEMKPAGARLFEDLSMRTQERRFGGSDVVQRLRWSMDRTLTKSSTTAVLEQKRVGIYDTAVLASTDGSALREWIRANAFNLPGRASGVLDEYVRKGWVFVVMKIAPEAIDSRMAGRLASGTIQPIRFRFPTREPVYPLRISSINGGGSEVLIYALAASQYVTRTQPHVAWESRMCGPMPHLSGVDPDSHYAADGAPTFLVSKLRATIRSRDMKDVTFDVYDPVKGLSSPDLEMRTEAASCIGWMKRSDCVPALIAFLRQPGPASQDVLSALWALGQTGTSEAIPVLVGRALWAGREWPECRLEALSSLSDLKAREALPLFVEGLARMPLSDDDEPAVMAERKLCLKSLLAFGDGSCIEPLWTMARAYGFQEIWDPKCIVRGETVPGRSTLAALAACGDSTARRVMSNAILARSDILARDALVGRAARNGSPYGFPEGFWIGAALVEDPIDHLYEWPALQYTMRLLKTRPDAMDDILRRAASDAGLPDCGRAFFLGCLHEPGEKDRRALDRIWSRAIGKDPAVTAETRVPVRTGQGVGEMYNLAASTVVYACTRFGDAPRLRRFWAECPADDRNLQGDIATGLSRCGNPTDLELVTSYVAREWNRIVSDPRFVEREKASGAHMPLRLADDTIDQEYRSSPIERYITSVPGGARAVEKLFTDRTLHPYLRLHWIDRIGYLHPQPAWLLAAAEQVLDPLQAEVVGNDWLTPLAANTRTLVDRMKHPRRAPRVSED